MSSPEWLAAVLAWAIPPELAGWEAVLLLATSFAASLITAALSLGGGAVLLGVMATIAPPSMLIPAHGMIQLGSNAGRAGMLIRHVSWPALGGFAVGSAIGAGLGGLVAVNLPPHLVEIAVGLFIVWSVLTRPPAWLKRWPWLTGVVSSFLTMFFGATGLFVAAYTKSLQLGRMSHVATHAALMTVQHLLKTVVFGLLGVAFGPWLGFILLMILAGLAGTLIGRSVLVRLTDQRFHRALDILLLCIAARLIWSGVTGG